MAIIRRYTYRGEEGERIPDEATHITVGDGVTFVRARAFQCHYNIVEVICHDKVEKIEHHAFFWCPSLRRVIMPGVKEVEEGAFGWCKALTCIDCGKLEIIGQSAFKLCESLRSINLPSARIVDREAFYKCTALTDVKFSSKLERVDTMAFSVCFSLERITIPLKDSLITCNNIFSWCKKLKHVDIVEKRAMHENATALHLEEWRYDMKQEIDSIILILPDARPGNAEFFSADYDEGEKARVIQAWIRSVLLKMIHYQAEHQRVLDEAATTLQFALPRDIVLNNVLPFLELPSYTCEADDEDSEDDDIPLAALRLR